MSNRNSIFEEKKMAKHFSNQLKSNRFFDNWDEFNFGARKKGENLFFFLLTWRINQIQSQADFDVKLRVFFFFGSRWVSASRTKHSYRMTLTFVTAPPLRSSWIHFAHCDVFHVENQHIHHVSMTLIAKFGLHSHGHASVLVSTFS